MASKVTAMTVDFDRIAQLLERMRVSEPKADRWTAAFEELQSIIATQHDGTENVVSIEPLISAA